MENFYLITTIAIPASIPAFSEVATDIFDVPVFRIILILTLVALAVFAGLMICKSCRNRQKTTDDKEVSLPKEDAESILKLCRDRLNDFLVQNQLIYSSGINSFLNEDITNLKAAVGLKKQLNKHLEELKKEIFEIASELESSPHSGHYYVELSDYQARIVQSVSLLIQPLYEHLNNSHKPFLKAQEEEMKSLERGIGLFYKQAVMQVNNQVRQMDKLEEIHSRTTEILDGMEVSQIRRIKFKQVNNRNSVLYLNTITETKNMLNYTLNLIKTYQKLMMV